MLFREALEHRRVRRRARRRRRQLEEERLRSRDHWLSDEDEEELLDRVNDTKTPERRRLWAMRRLGLVSESEDRAALREIYRREAEEGISGARAGLHP